MCVSYIWSLIVVSYDDILVNMTRVSRWKTNIAIGYMSINHVIGRTIAIIYTMYYLSYSFPLVENEPRKLL